MPTQEPNGIMRSLARFKRKPSAASLLIACWLSFQFQPTSALLNSNNNNNNNLPTSASAAPSNPSSVGATSVASNSNPPPSVPISAANQAQIITSPADVANGAILQALGQFAQQVAQQQTLGSVNSFSSSGASNAQTVFNNNQTAQASNGQPANSNQYIIKVIHNDSKNQLSYVSITPINNTNLHEPRIELRYQSKYQFVSLDERTPNNTVVAAIVVYDEDAGPNGETSLSIEHGNELGHFKLVSTTFTNTIQVNGAPLSRHRVPEYNLTIVARDHGSPPKSSSSNLVIKLYQSSAPTQPIASGSNAPLDPQPSSKPPVTDLMNVGLMLVGIFSALIFLIIIGCALVQRPKNKATHKGPPPSRASSVTNARLHPSDQCRTAYCQGLTNL